MKYQGQILRKDCQFSQINSNLLISIFTRYATLGRLSVICYLYALWIRKILVKLTLRKVFEESIPFFSLSLLKRTKNQQHKLPTCNIYTQKGESRQVYFLLHGSEEMCMYPVSVTSFFSGQEGFLSCLRTLAQ